jgi:predicted nucleic acid-binding protein
MDTKLTLKLDTKIISSAKNYASKQNKSLSKMVESYLSLLVIDEDNAKDEFEISPFIRSFTSPINTTENTDIKTEYHKHLEEKYT